MITYFLIFLSWIICFVYIFWIFKLYLAWLNIKALEYKSKSLAKISVIIAVRNEASNLRALLHSLLEQDFPFKNFELIFIDDHSEDDSFKLIQDFQKQHPLLPLYLERLSKDKTGKKAALKLGYSLAQYELVACTDGDCIVPKNWLKITANAFTDPKKMLFSGGVYLSQSHRFFSITNPLN